ncbi:hypothetical protein GCM10011365_24090 [Marinicella pacifica]|uniref:Fibronectin type-III domain-containing protein n=1 Tax=Marinicella pacifica TaxID=1171543 RepID=A0A917CYC9_9GAMM|nr:fibronectin type III domain-containing protein [Marinicella pacifica]GGG02092.1 hypothetical protein GCM10011365_24090 [Marinicella pacifica]
MKVKLYVFLVALFYGFIAQAAVPQAERDALVALYNSTDGDNWNENTNWLVGDPCDNSWYGITCGVDTVTKIILGAYEDGNNLTGSIPSDIENLSNLRNLELGFNHLTGTIPPEIGNLSNLEYLDLWNNLIEGQIPQELSQLNLISLELNSNRLEGNLPDWIGHMTSLRFLFLNKNKFYGEIPTSYENLIGLVAGGIGYNALYTDNQAIIDIFDYDREVQTLAPTEFEITGSSQSSISLKWSKLIPGFNWETRAHSGGHSLFISENPNGPFTKIHETVSKSEIAHTVTGLSPSTNYYFKIETFTNPSSEYNQNTVTSEKSVAVSTYTSNFSTEVDLEVSVEAEIRNSPSSYDYEIKVSNLSAVDVFGANLIHNLPHGTVNYGWTCEIESGSAVCPSISSDRDLDLLLDLPANSSLVFNSRAFLVIDEEDSGLMLATLLPPDNILDTDISNNFSSVNIRDTIFADGSFE